MKPVTAVLVYVVVWWIVLFTVLPWGAHAVENPELGHATSAPARPRLLLKFAVTTVIAGIVFAGLYWVIQADLFSFRS